MKAVILSGRTSYEEYLRHGRSFKDSMIFCINPEFCDWLESQGIYFTALDDRSLDKNLRNTINSWCCDRAAAWIRLCSEMNLFSKYDFSSVLFLRFSYYLVSLVRNLHFAKHILGKSSLTSVDCFQESRHPHFPVSASSKCLSYHLTELAPSYGVTVHSYQTSEEVSPRNQPVFKEKIRAFANKVYAYFGPQPHKASILVFGALNHLGIVISELIKRGSSVALYDDVFHWQQFRFAIRNKLQYMVAGSFSPVRTNKSDFVKKNSDEIIQAFRAAKH